MEYIPQYIRRMHDEEPVEFKHPQLSRSWARRTGSV